MDCCRSCGNCTYIHEYESYFCTVSKSPVLGSLRFGCCSHYKKKEDEDVNDVNTCVCCGAIIPEGRQICPKCETWGAAPDAILPDGTALYLKTPISREDVGVQLSLYEQLLGYKRALQKED